MNPAEDLVNSFIQMNDLAMQIQATLLETGSLWLKTYMILATVYGAIVPIWLAGRP